MKFSIVIPNVTKTAQKLTLLDGCLSSFMKHHLNSEYLQEVIVVDDGSDARFMSELDSIVSKNSVTKFIKREGNGGFSRAVNDGIRAAVGDAVILVNNDLTFTQEVLSFFDKDFASDPDVGVIGGLLFYPNGTIQHGGIMRIGNAFTHIGWHKTLSGAPYVEGKKFLIGVTGALFGISRSAIERVGLFDETFFLASEDTQYCLRTWLSGLKVLFDSSIRAVHVEGGTRGASDMDKLSQSLHTRNWYIQEMKTKATFLNWLKTIRLDDIDRKVAEAVGKQTVEVVRSNSLQKVDNPKSIGLVRSGAMGDVMMATPIVRELKRRYPSVNIVFATQCPDALRGNPDISAIVANKNELANMVSMVFDLDLAYENRPKSHIVDAYADVVFGERIDNKLMHLESNHNDFAVAHANMGGHVNFERDRVVAIHQAVSWANRTWPKPYWDHVVLDLTSRGYKVVVLGRGGDYRANMVAGVVNLVDRLTIPQVREVLKRSKLFIGPDSGLMHVAQTTNVPVIGLFTVANPEYRITRREHFTAMIPKSNCRFCLHEEKPPVTFVGCKIGTMQCVREITPVEVLSAAYKILR